MNVRFIDTTVMLNLLEVPDRCSDKELIIKQWKECLEEKDVLIMPIATIIETGNHIAHISQGNVRRNIAGKFAQFLIKTANDEAPWKMYGASFDSKELKYLADNIEDFASRKIGIGDMSIIYAYEQYRDTVPAVGTIMIWSTDVHLKSYREENVFIKRRRKSRT